MLHTEFQASKSSGSGEEGLFLLFMYFNTINQGAPGAGQF